MHVDPTACNLLRGRYHLPNRMAAFIAEVEDATAAAVQKRFQREDVRIGKIRDMHIIANTSPIRRIIIVAVNGERRTVSGRCKNTWDEMWLRVMKLANRPIGIGAGCIEVSERD